MGAGDFDAGLGEAGLDPVVASSPRGRVTPPAALFVRGKTKDFVLDANGRHVEAHPVDAEAFDALRIARGQIRSLPAFGEKVSQIRYIDRKKIRAQVDDAVRQAWGRLIADKKIAFLELEIDATQKGRVAYVATYENLLTSKRRSVPGIL